MRTVVIGAKGFIGKAVVKKLQEKNENLLSISRAECDLLEKGQLESLLQDDDRVIFLSCITPDKGRGTAALLKNVQMGEHFCQAVLTRKIRYIVYLSSDAVYSMDRGMIFEDSATDPQDMYGAMHLCREKMVKSLGIPTAILRSTLVYGAADTHNSYGPNRLRRMALKEGKITLFGAGEEMRDHIYIDDVAELIYLNLINHREGMLNLATGKSISYWDLANKIVKAHDKDIEICKTDRKSAITHRHFDVTPIYKTFPEFRFTEIDEGLRRAWEEEKKSGTGTGTYALG